MCNIKQPSKRVHVMPKARAKNLN